MSTPQIDIPFAMDLQQSRGSSLEQPRAVKEALFSPYLDGFVVLLSDGRAALVAPSMHGDKHSQRYILITKGGGCRNF
jgi:hypothetical protein